MAFDHGMMLMSEYDDAYVDVVLMIRLSKMHKHQLYLIQCAKG